VLLEAMASGLPVIATDVGGNREAVADGVTGFLVPPRAPERLAEVAIQLASHPDQAHRFAEKARSSAEERFSVGRMLRAHEEIYCTLLKIQSRSPWSRIL
jgi:glycosyltransferase involved in cell wall biosynthesis